MGTEKRLSLRWRGGRGENGGDGREVGRGEFGRPAEYRPPDLYSVQLPVAAQPRRNGYEKRTGPLNFSGPVVGAQDRTRTCTLSLALVPETSVSTNSTTWAWLVGCPGFRSPERSANIRKNRNRANFSEIFLFQSFARMVFVGVTVVCRTAAEGKEADSGCGRGRRKGGGERAGVFPVAAGPFALLLRGRAGEPQRERAEQFGRNWKEQSVGCRRKRPVAVGVTGAVCGRFRFRQTHDGYERESPVGASRGTVLLRQYVRKV